MGRTLGLCEIHEIGITNVFHIITLTRSDDRGASQLEKYPTEILWVRNVRKCVTSCKWVGFFISTARGILLDDLVDFVRLIMTGFLVFLYYSKE